MGRVDRRARRQRAGREFRRPTNLGDHRHHNSDRDSGRGQLWRDVVIQADSRDRAAEIWDEFDHRLRVARRGGVHSTASVFTAG